MEKQRRQAIQQSVQCTSSFVEYVLYFIKQLEAEFQSDIHKWEHIKGRKSKFDWSPYVQFGCIVWNISWPR